MLLTAQAWTLPAQPQPPVLWRVLFPAQPQAERAELQRALRAGFGAGLHLTGGLSNVSYGLPARRLLNDVFIDLAVAAGADSGIIDPVANDLRRVAGLDRGARPYQLAADLLTGADPYGGQFLTAFRAGELG